jgi:hypothetical protein
LAVGDILPARIRALRSKNQGCKNVAEFWRGNGAQPTYPKHSAQTGAWRATEPPTGGEALTGLLGEAGRFYLKYYF